MIHIRPSGTDMLSGLHFLVSIAVATVLMIFYPKLIFCFLLTIHLLGLLKWFLILWDSTFNVTLARMLRLIITFWARDDIHILKLVAVSCRKCLAPETDSYKKRHDLIAAASVPSNGGHYSKRVLGGWATWATPAIFPAMQYKDT